MARDVSNSGPRPPSLAIDDRGEWKLALDHARSRNARIVKVFCYLSVMRAAGWIAKGARISISPDTVDTPQDYNATGGNQAAHCMPGFVAIRGAGGKTTGMWDFAKDPAIRALIYALFEYTDDLPASYNKADTAAEGWVSRGPRGLKQLLETCCQNLVSLDPPRSAQTGEIYLLIDEPAVMAAWELWATESVSIYKRAAAAKELRTAQDRPANVPTTPVTDISRGALREWQPGDFRARVEDLGRTVSNATGTVGEFKDQASFLHAYELETQPQPAFLNGARREVHGAFSSWKASQLTVT